MCGTMIPTKPISPLTETAAAVPAVAAATTSSRVRRDVDAEARRLVVAEAHHVEHAPVEDQHDRADARCTAPPRATSLQVAVEKPPSSQA